MGLFAYSYDVDALRAIAYARLQIAAGVGLETVTTILSRADLGLVSAALRRSTARMQQGEGTHAVLQAEIAEHPSRSYRELLASLLAEGPAAVVRMDELSEEIQVERKVRIENFAKGVESKLKFLALVFILSFGQVFAQIFEQVDENPILPSFTLPPTFLFGFYLTLSMAIGGLTLAMRYRE